ncbi:glucuronide permease [Virgibacillus phasianinus]|uniref:Glucuronide permease n=1 Tax=Virgibacillus phasianinus TaxID=2017483 RepID=A0A220TZ66_9BACI|nr:MFS transporter [Virgibacillus phasianinus]ASK60966.1 glucuronide permease [Virgibacillus phasianinus]
MASTTTESDQEYNRAKIWQIGFFALNNTATNLYMFILTFVTYYATGIAGLAVVAVSTVLTAMRIFDGITDPIVGFIVDKTESNFGKFRPFMIIGNVILAGSILIMYNVTHLLPQSFQLIFFIVMYAIYIIGYTLQTTVTKAAQTVLTNDPKQRPLYSVFDASYNALIFTGGQVFVASYLIAKYGDFTMALFTELNTYAIIFAGICTILAVIGISGKDRKEYYGLAEKTVNTRFRDYWPILKKNRPLQMLITATTVDKLAFMLIRYSVVAVMIFGILMGDYGLSGSISLITIAPTLIITFIVVAYARKLGMRSAFMGSTWIALFSLIGLIGLFLIMNDPTTISGGIGIPIVIFTVLYTMAISFGGIPSSLVNPMIADVSDYETSKTGRYIPGMLGTLFSFIDKLVTSLAPAIVGLGVAIIGFGSEFPTVTDELTTPLFVMTLILAFGLPAVMLVISLTAMKFYKLDDKKMKEIQRSIAEVKMKENKDDDNSQVM